jgi:hypothetical protein
LLGRALGSLFEGWPSKLCRIFQYGFVEHWLLRAVSALCHSFVQCGGCRGCFKRSVIALAQSGQLPLPFLRGCGLSDAFIEFLPSLLQKAIQFYSCFISYSTRDQEFADRIHADLQNNGVRCWFAADKIQAGKKIHEQIDEAIRLYDRLLLILSEHSMESEWVKTEIARARQKELNQRRQVLFPIGLTPFSKIRAWKCFDAETQRFGAGDSEILCAGFQQLEGP